MLLLSPRSINDFFFIFFLITIGEFKGQIDESCQIRHIKSLSSVKSASNISFPSNDFKGFESEVDRIVYNNDGEEIENVINKILKIVR